MTEIEKNPLQEMQPDDIEVLEIYEEDYKSAKVRLRQAMTDRALKEWYNSLEEFAADKFFQSIMKWDKVSKADETILKYLRFMWEAEGWTNATKEFTVKSNVPTLGRKVLLTP